MSLPMKSHRNQPLVRAQRSKLQRSKASRLRRGAVYKEVVGPSRTLTGRPLSRHFPQTEACSNPAFSATMSADRLRYTPHSSRESRKCPENARRGSPEERSSVEPVWQPADCCWLPAAQTLELPARRAGPRLRCRSENPKCRDEEHGEIHERVEAECVFTRLLRVDIKWGCLVRGTR